METLGKETGPSTEPNKQLSSDMQNHTVTHELKNCPNLSKLNTLAKPEQPEAGTDAAALGNFRNPA